jgi:excisionase family DNA binding protein
MVDPFDPVEDLVSTQDAARIVGVTENNFRQLVHKKLITVAYKRGRSVVFHRADVMRLAESRASKRVIVNAGADTDA